jgi:hypothetical protein
MWAIKEILILSKHLAFKTNFISVCFQSTLFNLFNLASFYSIKGLYNTIKTSYYLSLLLWSILKVGSLKISDMLSAIIKCMYL